MPEQPLSSSGLRPLLNPKPTSITLPPPGHSPLSPEAKGLDRLAEALSLPPPVEPRQEQRPVLRGEGRGPQNTSEVKNDPEKKPEKQPEKKPAAVLAFEPTVVRAAGDGEQFGQISKFSIQLHPTTDPQRNYILFSNPPRGVIDEIKLGKPELETKPDDPKAPPTYKVAFETVVDKKTNDQGFIRYDAKGNPVEYAFTLNDGEVVKKQKLITLAKLDRETFNEVVTDTDRAAGALEKGGKHTLVSVFVSNLGLEVPDGYMVTKDNKKEFHLFKLVHGKAEEVPIDKLTENDNNASLTIESGKRVYRIKNPDKVFADARTGTVATARGTFPLIDVVETLMAQEDAKKK